MEFETIWASGTERKVHIEATLGPRDGHFSQSIREMSEIIESNQTKENPISSNKTCKLHTTLIQKTLFACRQCLPHLKKQGPPLHFGGIYDTAIQDNGIAVTNPEIARFAAVCMFWQCTCMMHPLTQGDAWSCRRRLNPAIFVAASDLSKIHEPRTI